jgi:phosphatidylethanolamine/phosphatidyl-N-methylethanolamine N-methyltransferase
MPSQTIIEKSAKIIDEFRFIRSWFDNPLRTGAVTPSGAGLARAMARFVDTRASGAVIELGPGTGVVTKALVDRGVSPDRLVLIEFYDEFCELLQKRFPEATVIGGDAYSVRSLLCERLGEPATAVVSSLPLLTKPAIIRTQLLEDCFSLLEAGRPFVQYTYAVQPPIPPKYCDAELAGSKLIWLNLPPARVWAYRRPPED